MRLKCIRLNSVHFNHDTMSLTDEDGREIVFRRIQINELKTLFSGRLKRRQVDLDESREEDKK